MAIKRALALSLLALVATAGVVVATHNVGGPRVAAPCARDAGPIRSRRVPRGSGRAGTLRIEPGGNRQGHAHTQRDFTSVVLDFGPGSVDGWLAGLVAAELGLGDELRVDAEARGIVIADRRVQLTPLEYAVLACLQQQEGRSVTRATLLEEVWGYRSDIGSNVVDAVVRRLRAKIGEQYAVVETVRGSGYRLTIQ